MHQNFKEVTGKVKLRSSTHIDKRDGRIVHIGSKNSVDSTTIVSKTKKKKKTPEDKYKDHYLARFNKYVEVAETGKRQGLSKGFKYHTTLTISDENLKIGRVPSYLSREVKYLLKENGITGISVLERGKDESGKLHAHILSDRRITSDWWKYGYVKTKKIKSNKHSVGRYMKKSFHACALKNAYYEPTTDSVVEMTDHQFFSERWGKGRKECKLIISPELKVLEKKVAELYPVVVTLGEHFIEAGLKADSNSMYTQTFALRSATFMACYKKLIENLEDCMQQTKDDSLFSIALGSFDNFSERVKILHNGTCGYSLSVNLLNGINEEHRWTLKFYMGMESKGHWFTESNKHDVREGFKRLQEIANSII